MADPVQVMIDEVGTQIPSCQEKGVVRFQLWGVVRFQLWGLVPGCDPGQVTQCFCSTVPPLVKWE